MRVLLLTNIPSPYRVAFFNELGKTCDLTVCFERANALDRDEKWFDNNSDHYNSIFLKGLKTGNDSALCPSIIRIIKKRNYDIIVIGGYSTLTGMLAILTLTLLRIPFILSSDGGYIKTESKIKAAIKRFFINKAKWWLSTGTVTDQYLVHYGAKATNIYRYSFTSLKEKDVYERPTNDHERAIQRAAMSIPGDRMVLAVGQFIPRKGFDVAIKAFELLPDHISLVLVGGGPEEQAYREIIQDQQLKNVVIVNFQKKKELIKYYRTADVFLMPTREDIWGLVVNEAMACGLPIISTTAALSALELVENGINGYLVPVDDSKAISDSIGKILNSQDSMHDMGLRNLEKIHQYTIEKMAEQHILIFRQLLDDKERQVGIIGDRKSVV